MLPLSPKRLHAAQRALAMDLPDIAGFTRHDAARWHERARIVRSSAPRAHIAVAPQQLRTAWRERFFEDIAVKRLRAQRDAQLAAACDAVIARADRISTGTFDFLGHRNLHFGHPIDWHLDPINHRRAPSVHWSLLGLLDSTALADSKIIWELNRHQWMVHLGQAYRLTGDEHYAQICAARLREWMRHNPTGIGINWSSNLEVSFRLISWCWVLHLFRAAAAFSGSLFNEVTSSIAIHAAHVEK